MFEGVEVFAFVVSGVVLPHAPEQFEPAFAQATEGAGVVVTVVAFGLVIGLGPSAGLTTGVGPEMDGVS